MCLLVSDLQLYVNYISMQMHYWTYYKEADTLKTVTFHVFIEFLIIRYFLLFAFNKSWNKYILETAHAVINLFLIIDFHFVLWLSFHTPVLCRRSLCYNTGVFFRFRFKNFSGNISLADTMAVLSRNLICCSD